MYEWVHFSDVIVIVGDLVDGLVTDLKDAVQPLQNLNSKYGVLYVTGKKEYQEEKQKWSSLCNWWDKEYPGKKNSGYEVKKMHYMIRICM